MPITNGEKTTAFILARLTSSRMPAKHFRHIGSKTMLAWIVSRLRQCREIDEIIITTAAEPENEPLKNYAREEGLACFWYEGEVNQVTTRLRRAAEWSESDTCVLISGDCPLIYAPVLDEMLNQFKAVRKRLYAKERHNSDNATIQKNGDIFVLDNDCPRDLGPAIYGINIAGKEAWQKADDLSDRPELKEHHFPVIGQKPELFNAIKGNITADICLPPTRLFVDTYADLQFMNRLYETLTSAGKLFELPDVVDLLRQKPKLCEISSHVHQRRLIEDTKQVLFVVDAGGNFGCGHLMRSVELAMQIVERLSWPVTFVIDDAQGRKILQERGFRTVCSALGRRVQLPDKGTNIGDISRLNDYDLVILDLADRPIPGNWRDVFHKDAGIVVLDKAASWTKTADLIIIPGVCDRRKTNHLPNLTAGKRFVIVRREVRQAAESFSPTSHLQPHVKDIDITAYLPDERRKKQLMNFCQKHSLVCHIVKGGDDTFPGLLTRSKVFLGNYGYSFYEALYLDAFPIAWPTSQVHGRDALNFYKKFGLSAAVIENNNELDGVILSSLQKLASGKIKIPSLLDGTPAIVEILRQLATPNGGEISADRNKHI